MWVQSTASHSEWWQKCSNLCYLPICSMFLYLSISLSLYFHFINFCVSVSQSLFGSLPVFPSFYLFILRQLSALFNSSSIAQRQNFAPYNCVAKQYFLWLFFITIASHKMAIVVFSMWMLLCLLLNICLLLSFFALAGFWHRRKFYARFV